MASGTCDTESECASPYVEQRDHREINSSSTMPDDSRDARQFGCCPGSDF
jgi:hypothetical protein